MKEQVKRIWSYTRYWLGYGLFAIYVFYSIRQAPDVLGKLQPGWILLVAAIILLTFALDVVQFSIFLRHHRLPLNIWLASHFTAQKSILNIILPAKAGTLLCIHMITRHYKLKWHEYVQFMIITILAMLSVSGLAFLGLVSSMPVFVVVVALFSLLVWFSKKWITWRYTDEIIPLIVVSVGAYLCRLFIFWVLLQDLSHDIGFYEASIFAIVTITLAQISITPGNMGIREMTLGLLAPYLSLPMSTGVLIGAVAQIIRIVLYAMILLVVTLLSGDRLPNAASNVPPVDDTVKF